MNEEKLIITKMENGSEFVFYSNYPGHRPFNVRALKKLSDKKKIDCLIDVVDYVVNEITNNSTVKFFSGLQKVLKDSLKDEE